MSKRSTLFFAALLLTPSCGDDAPPAVQSSTGGGTTTSGGGGSTTGQPPVGESTGTQTARVEIIIDDNGIPHIYGRTDADAFYGAGYQMATDRLFHMEMTRRRAYGTLAEVLGEPGAEDDEISRLFDFASWGEQHTAKMMTEAPDMYALLTSWTEGVNARIAEVNGDEVSVPHGFGPQEYDFRPEAWTVADIMTIATLTSFGNDLSFDAEIFVSIAFRVAADAFEAIDLFRPARDTFTTAYGDRSKATRPPGLAYSPQPYRPARRTPAQAFDPKDLAIAMHTLKRLGRLRVGMGSNNWAVSGEHTASGRPIVAGDPHLDWETPGIFYAQHINSLDQEGTIDAAGFSFVGTPGISVGHTRGVVWTPTTAFADTMDVWAVQQPDEDSVLIAGETRALTTTEVTIIVRGDGDPVGEGTSRSLDVTTVEGRGVVIPSSLVPIPVGEENDILVLDWAGFTPSAFASLLDFNRVEDVDSYEAAVATFGGNYNFVAADAQTITHANGTKVPVRTVVPESPPWLVMDGDLPGTQWGEGFLPPEQLPGSRGGSRGFVSTANNDPFGFSQDGRLDNDPWYFGAFFAPAWRAGRIEAELQRMTEAGGITPEDMQALQMDTHSNIADDLLPILEQASQAIGSDKALTEFEGNADLEALITLLLAWDRNYDTETAEGLVFFLYQHFITSHVLRDEMTLLFQQAMDLQPVFIMKIAVNAMRGAFESGDAVLQEGRDWIALAALRDTADYLNEHFGSVDPSGYKMGDVKFSLFNGTTGRGLSRGKFATPGSDDVVQVAASHNFFTASAQVSDEFLSKHGSIFRHVTTFAEDGTPELFFNMPLGNVAEPSSPHYEDLNDDWLSGRYRKMWFTRAEVEEHEESRFVLLPD